MTTFDFSGKVAFVTGAASGIGLAVSQALYASGASVMMADMNAQRLQEEATALGTDRTATVVLDVTDPAAVEAAIAATEERFGGLDLAFNNAGIGGPVGDIETIDIEGYRRLIDVNLNSVFYGMRYEVPAMLRRGGGAIVNTSSILGLVAEPTALPYTTAKHGVAGMTKAAGTALAARGIRVNSVHPGYIETPLLAHVPEETINHLISLHPAGRLGTADEAAHVVLFLMSDMASFVAGSQYVVDGGYTAQ